MCFYFQVKEAAESLQPGVIAQACGSYRRGKKDCGDVDILLTHPDGHSEKGLFGKLIQRLKQTGESAVFDRHEKKKEKKIIKPDISRIRVVGVYSTILAVSLVLLKNVQ